MITRKMLMTQTRTRTVFCVPGNMDRCQPWPPDRSGGSRPTSRPPPVLTRCPPVRRPPRPCSKHNWFSSRTSRPQCNYTLGRAQQGSILHPGVTQLFPSQNLFWDNLKSTTLQKATKCPHCLKPATLLFARLGHRFSNINFFNLNISPNCLLSGPRCPQSGIWETSN